jgi:hypothetical protein
MLQRDGHPTALGEAIAMYGRIFKSLHILSYIDSDETYRRDIKGIRNLQEGRHALARKICHGRKGELYHRYERGLENQLGALGLGGRPSKPERGNGLVSSALAAEDSLDDGGVLGRAGSEVPG